MKERRKKMNSHGKERGREGNTTGKETERKITSLPD